MISVFGQIYKGKRVLVTGHSGFKGSWLVLWLQELGADVIGVSHPPMSEPNHWDLLELSIDERCLDICDFPALDKVFSDRAPEIVFHLAAQPLVRRSYREPVKTWHTNVIGTANVLEACRRQKSVKSIVSVTTDKCYENREWAWAYRENDRLGGHDPYSASKAAAELVAASYRDAFFSVNDGPLLATARAGNVIGGGDWSEDRLVPDLVRALVAQQSLEIRSPLATRPWQHVMESLSGYLLLGQVLLMGGKEFAQGWNFGPESQGNRTVSEVLENLCRNWEGSSWHVSKEPQSHEAMLLNVDSSKARGLLGWKPVWDFDTTVRQTADWYRAWLEARVAISKGQLSSYVEDARRSGCAWATS